MNVWNKLLSSSLIWSLTRRKKIMVDSFILTLLIWALTQQQINFSRLHITSLRRLWSVSSRETDLWGEDALEPDLKECFTHILCLGIIFDEPHTKFVITTSFLPSLLSSCLAQSSWRMDYLPCQDSWRMDYLPCRLVYLENGLPALSSLPGEWSACPV